MIAALDLYAILSFSLWLMLASALAVGGVHLARAVRRSLRQEPAAEPFTLHELREMRARQEITEAEFATLRAALLARAAAAPGKQVPHANRVEAQSAGPGGEPSEC